MGHLGPSQETQGSLAQVGNPHNPALPATGPGGGPGGQRDGVLAGRAP